MVNDVKLLINTAGYTLNLLSALCAGAVVMGISCVGRAVEVQLRPPVMVKLQPSVVSGRGLVNSGGGGYTWAPMPTHRDTTKPDTRPDKAPWRTL